MTRYCRCNSNSSVVVVEIVKTIFLFCRSISVQFLCKVYETNAIQCAFDMTEGKMIDIKYENFF